jgi:nitroimidazol reductase NimA-like FMN-containing flavoprotein (pyridoxamine 5'-phosphate oxidase superfamily)
MSTKLQPVTELNPAFSSPNAGATPWPEAQARFEAAQVYWIATARPNGMPNLAPLIAVWVDDALYFSSGENERKAKNLADNPQVAVMTGCNDLGEGFDSVVEGNAVVVSDDATLRRVDDAYEAKYGEGWRLAGLEGVLLFEVKPATAFGFGRGRLPYPPGPPGERASPLFSQTRWRF